MHLWAVREIKAMTFTRNRKKNFPSIFFFVAFVCFEINFNNFTALCCFPYFSLLFSFYSVPNVNFFSFSANCKDKMSLLAMYINSMVNLRELEVFEFSLNFQSSLCVIDSFLFVIVSLSLWFPLEFEFKQRNVAVSKKIIIIKIDEWIFIVSYFNNSNLCSFLWFYLLMRCTLCDLYENEAQHFR